MNLSPEPKSRQEFLDHSCKLTLDPNTANKHLCLSEGDTVATNSYTDQSYPDHPGRFEGCSQVLCRESMGGRCYWEVEWSGPRGVGVAVSYNSIPRKGNGPDVFGWSDQSWDLFCHSVTCSFSHNSMEQEIPGVSLSSRIGVYVDHRAGTLSFYSVSDTMQLLHRVQTTFTQPLYAGFWIPDTNSKSGPTDQFFDATVSVNKRINE
ncbi:hypothetical protein NFI96_010429 [Prochilodus magdalenae]|nr:hypothetical protein NFI96_010429 [Prochilodus magdalenae]